LSSRAVAVTEDGKSFVPIFAQTTVTSGTPSPNCRDAERLRISFGCDS
jgi:hypothetical protein